MGNVYISVKQAAELLEISARAIRKSCAADKYVTRITKGTGGDQYEIDLVSLPLSAQKKYFSAHNSAVSGETTPGEPSDGCSLSEAPRSKASEAEIYANLTAYNRQICDRNLAILTAVGSRKGKEAFIYINNVWNVQHPENAISYKSFQRIQTAHRRYGIAGICGKYGRNEGISVISDELFEKFMSLYIGSGNPESAYSCWLTLRGYALAEGLINDISQFPSKSSFVRLVESRKMKQAIVRIREGKDAWKKKHSYSINVNEESISSGEVFVGDHGKFDIFVILPDGSLGRPWISVISDYKSRMILGYDVFYDNPNGDKIILCMKRAFEFSGIPAKLLFDNGKDYRRKDIGGGRIVRTSELVDSFRPTITNTLGIEMHYAIPYNSQSKPVERVFGIMREYFDKKFPGYCGSDGKKRPDRTRDMESKFIKLKKAGEDPEKAGFTTFDSFVKLVNIYVDIHNKRAFQSGKFAGQSPTQVWVSDAPVMRAATQPELAILCASSGEPGRVNRNCIRDSRSGRLYFGAWMMMYEGTGQRFFLRVDPESPETAYCFEAVIECYNQENGKPVYSLGRFVNTAKLQAKPGLYQDEDEILSNEMQIKRFVDRESRIALKDAVGAEVPVGEKFKWLAESVNAQHEASCKASGISTDISKPRDIAITPFSHVPAAIEKEKTNGIWDTGLVADPIRSLKKENKSKLRRFGDIEDSGEQ